VKTSAIEPLISTRLFAVTKWSAWLVSKESLRLWGSKSSYTKICYGILPHSPVVSLQTAHKKHKVYKTPLFLILWEDETNMQECLHMVKWGVRQVASEPPWAPGYYTPPFRETGQQEDLLANLMLLTSGSRLPGNNLWGKFSYLTFVLYCFVHIGH
jgi:hypothetical protein